MCIDIAPVSHHVWSAAKNDVKVVAHPILTRSSGIVTDTAADGHPCGGSLLNLAFGQRLVEFLDSGVRHPRAFQVEEFEFREWGQFLEPSVCHFRVGKINTSNRF